MWGSCDESVFVCLIVLLVELHLSACERNCCVTSLAIGYLFYFMTWRRISNILFFVVVVIIRRRHSSSSFLSSPVLSVIPTHVSALRRPPPPRIIRAGVSGRRRRAGGGGRRTAQFAVESSDPLAAVQIIGSVAVLSTRRRLSRVVQSHSCTRSRLERLWASLR